ncbi:MAG: hypothetical protein RLZ61_23, partial [Planctomycetota bacterium]
LLDTHSLLWFLNEDPHLVPNAKALIEDSLNRKFVSMATCWEIAAVKDGSDILGH